MMNGKRIPRYLLASMAFVLCWRGISQAQVPLPGAICPPGAPCDVMDLGDGGPTDIFFLTYQALTLPLPTLPYTPISTGYYQNALNNLLAGVNGGSFCIDCGTGTADFVGWAPYIDAKGNSTERAHLIVTHVLTTAQNAITTTTGLAGTQLDATAIAQIATSNPSLYALIQTLIASNLMLKDELEMLRAQSAAQTIVEATRLAEDINTRAQFQAQSALNFWGMD